MSYSERTGLKARAKKLAQTILGLDEASAVEQAKNEGFQLRVEQREDQTFYLTKDIRFDRVNVIIKNGKVAEAFLE